MNIAAFAAVMGESPKKNKMKKTRHNRRILPASAFGSPPSQQLLMTQRWCTVHFIFYFIFFLNATQLTTEPKLRLGCTCWARVSQRSIRLRNAKLSTGQIFNESKSGSKRKAKLVSVTISAATHLNRGWSLSGHVAR